VKQINKCLCEDGDLSANDTRESRELGIFFCTWMYLMMSEGDPLNERRWRKFWQYIMTVNSQTLFQNSSGMILFLSRGVFSGTPTVTLMNCITKSAIMVSTIKKACISIGGKKKWRQFLRLRAAGKTPIVTAAYGDDVFNVVRSPRWNPVLVEYCRIIKSEFARFGHDYEVPDEYKAKLIYAVDDPFTGITSRQGLTFLQKEFNPDGLIRIPQINQVRHLMFSEKVRSHAKHFIPLRPARIRGQPYKGATPQVLSDIFPERRSSILPVQSGDKFSLDFYRKIREGEFVLDWTPIPPDFESMIRHWGTPCK
jgi:hypothetical protein